MCGLINSVCVFTQWTTPHCTLVSASFICVITELAFECDCTSCHPFVGGDAGKMVLFNVCVHCLNMHNTLSCFCSTISQQNVIAYQTMLSRAYSPRLVFFIWRLTLFFSTGKKNENRQRRQHSQPEKARKGNTALNTRQMTIAFRIPNLQHTHYRVTWNRTTTPLRPRRALLDMAISTTNGWEPWLCWS